jgi:transcriptional regulator with XRE-family HTH domain
LSIPFVGADSVREMKKKVDEISRKKRTPQTFVGESIREKIRMLRKQKGLTLKEMAGSCNCSTALLSQIETGYVNPSLSTLMSIADALGVSIASLFSETFVKEEASPFFMKPGERKHIVIPGGIHFQLLSKGTDVPFEFLLNRYPPGTSDGVDHHAHEGVECVFLLEGDLRIEINDAIYQLKPGDSITYSSSLPHRISNPGMKDAVVVSVDSEPFIFSSKY